MIKRKGWRHTRLSTAILCFNRIFCNRWHAHLKTEIERVQSESVEAQKQKLLDDLYRRISTYQKMDGVDQSGDISKVGRLWDMAASSLSQQDVTLLKRFVAFLAKNPELQAIAEQLGRMANHVDSQAPSQQLTETLKIVPEKQIDVPDDITGICQSDRVDRLLPNEAVLLADPALETVFYKQLVDKQLLNYQMTGQAHRRKKVETHVPSQSKPEQKKGAFYHCCRCLGLDEWIPRTMRQSARLCIDAHCRDGAS